MLLYWSQNNSLWNDPLYDVIVWLNTATAEEDKRLLLHHCLVQPAHWFTHNVYERSERTDLHGNQTKKMPPNTTRQVCQVVEKTVFALLPSDSSVRKEWMNFILSEDPDHISKNSALCLLHFTPDSFTNKAQFDAGFFRKIETEIQYCVDYIGSDSNVATHHVWVNVLLL